MRTMGDCRVCGNRLVVPADWRAGTDRQRRVLAATGHHVHQGRRLCRPCYDIRKGTDALIDFPRETHDARDVLEEYDAMDHRPGQSQASRCRELAPRLGMSWKAVEKAVNRARQVAA